MTTRVHAASPRPLRVVSVSLGSSKRNHEVEVEMLGVGTQVAVIALALRVIRRAPQWRRPTGASPRTARKLCVPPEIRAAPLGCTKAPRGAGRAHLDLHNVGPGE